MTHIRAHKGIDLGVMIASFAKHGGNLSAVADELGCDQRNVARRLWNAYEDGDERINADLLLSDRRVKGNTMEAIIKARIELGLRNDRKSEHGSWKKASLIANIFQGPIMLGIFGDPHYDNAGTDLDLFEEELSRVDPDQGIYAACVGDFFDNWPRALGHLYAESGDPAPAWVMFEYWMDNFPFLFSVTGNHDEWPGGSHLKDFFRQRGMILRRSGGRFILPIGGEPITITMRHIWRGSSQYSEAHALKRAATFGFTDDDVVVGGHTHQGEVRKHIRPSDGKLSQLVQVSSFKRLDNFANDKGLMSPETHPVVWLVLDGREPVTSHNRVQAFYDFASARAILEHQRGKNG